MRQRMQKVDNKIKWLKKERERMMKVKEFGRKSYGVLKGELVCFGVLVGRGNTTYYEHHHTSLLLCGNLAN